MLPINAPNVYHPIVCYFEHTELIPALAAVLWLLNARQLQMKSHRAECSVSVKKVLLVLHNVAAHSPVSPRTAQALRLAPHALLMLSGV